MGFQGVCPPAFKAAEDTAPKTSPQRHEIRGRGRPRGVRGLGHRSRQGTLEVLAFALAGGWPSAEAPETVPWARKAARGRPATADRPGSRGGGSWAPGGMDLANPAEYSPPAVRTPADTTETKSQTIAAPKAPPPSAASPPEGGGLARGGRPGGPGHPDRIRERSPEAPNGGPSPAAPHVDAPPASNPSPSDGRGAPSKGKEPWKTPPKLAPTTARSTASG